MTGESIEAALLEDNRLRCYPPLGEAEVVSIARSIARYAPGDIEFLSAPSKNDEKAERNLHFKSGAEIAKETPAEVPWVVRPFVAFGTITEIDGKVKLAGKTTFVTHLVRAVLDGSRFLGEPTHRTKVLYLTEQPLVSFRSAMERADLLGRLDFTALFWGDTIGIPWTSVARGAIDWCKRSGARLLVVDTLPQFAGLLGDAENHAGDALRALLPLQQAAAENIGVVMVRHERKSGGALGDSGRGSSAFAGAVDIILSIRRPEGNQKRSVREIRAVSRLCAMDDLLIELTDAGSGRVNDLETHAHGI
jgi:hypothetical protein